MASLSTESEPPTAPTEHPLAALNPGGLPRAAFGEVLKAVGIRRRDERETALLILVALGERQFVRRGGSWRNATEARAARNAPWVQRRIVAREGSGPALRTVRRVLGKLRSAGVVTTIVRRRQRADGAVRVVGARTATHTSAACVAGYPRSDPWAGYDALGRCLSCSVSLRGPGETSPFGESGVAWRQFALWGAEMADPPSGDPKVADPPDGAIATPLFGLKVADPRDKVADPQLKVADPRDKVADPPDSYGGGEDGGSDGGREDGGSPDHPLTPSQARGNGRDERGCRRCTLWGDELLALLARRTMTVEEASRMLSVRSSRVSAHAAACGPFGAALEARREPDRYEHLIQR